MSLFGKLSKKKNEEKTEDFLMPIAGEVIDIAKIPDPVFAQKMMGDGFGIVPAGNKVFSPVTGEIVSIFPTNHALGLKMENGIEILVHVGIDTVSLNGDGFDMKVAVGDKINAGDLLIEVDFDKIKELVPSIVTPIIFTDLKDFKIEIEPGTYEEKQPGIVKFKK